MNAWEKKSGLVAEKVAYLLEFQFGQADTECMTTTQPLAEATITHPGWGELWGCGADVPMYVNAERVHVWMYRKGQKCRFYDETGTQHGPDHKNVVPAMIWAVMNGWSDPTDPIGTLRMREEIEANTIKVGKLKNAGVKPHEIERVVPVSSELVA